MAADGGKGVIALDQNHFGFNRAGRPEGEKEKGRKKEGERREEWDRTPMAGVPVKKRRG